MFASTYVLAVVILSSFTASILYSWFGIAYALTLLAVFKLVLDNVNTLLTAVLFSQLVAAVISSLYRKNRFSHNKKDSYNIYILTITSVLSFATALFLGVKISESYRTYLIGGLLFFSGCLILASLIKKRTNVRSEEMMSLIIGFLGGMVKGIVGAGITPILVSLQSISGVSFEKSIHRTIFSEILVLIAVLIPYTIAYGIVLDVTISASVGALLGAFAGYYLSKPLEEKMKGTISALVMILLSILVISNMI